MPDKRWQQDDLQPEKSTNGPIREAIEELLEGVQESTDGLLEDTTDENGRIRDLEDRTKEPLDGDEQYELLKNSDGVAKMCSDSALLNSWSIIEDIDKCRAECSDMPECHGFMEHSEKKGRKPFCRLIKEFRCKDQEREAPSNIKFYIKKGAPIVASTKRKINLLT
jgi:hypothetical protein